MKRTIDNWFSRRFIIVNRRWNTMRRPSGPAALKTITFFINRRQRKPRYVRQ
jgi:hypothetical protein